MPGVKSLAIPRKVLFGLKYHPCNALAESYSGLGKRGKGSAGLDKDSPREANIHLSKMC